MRGALFFLFSPFISIGDIVLTILKLRKMDKMGRGTLALVIFPRILFTSSGLIISILILAGPLSFAIGGVTAFAGSAGIALGVAAILLVNAVTRLIGALSSVDILKTVNLKEPRPDGTTKPIREGVRVLVILPQLLCTISAFIISTLILAGPWSFAIGGITTFAGSAGIALGLGAILLVSAVTRLIGALASARIIKGFSIEGSPSGETKKMMKKAFQFGLYGHSGVGQALMPSWAGFKKYALIPLVAWGFCVAAAFSLFGGSFLSVPGETFMTGILASPIFTFALAAVAVTFIAHFVFRKVNLSVVEKVSTRALISANEAVKILDELAELEKNIASEKRKATPAEEAKIKAFKTALGLYAQDLLALLESAQKQETKKQLGAQTSSTVFPWKDALLNNLPDPTAIADEFKDLENFIESGGFYSPPAVEKKRVAAAHGLVFESKHGPASESQPEDGFTFSMPSPDPFRPPTAPERKAKSAEAEDTQPLLATVDMPAAKVGVPAGKKATTTRERLRTIFGRIAQAEIDPTYQRRFSKYPSRHLVDTWGYPLLSATLLFACIYTLFQVFNGGIALTVSMGWPVLIAAGCGFFSWVAARFTLNHTVGGPYPQWAAVFGMFTITLISLGSLLISAGLVSGGVGAGLLLGGIGSFVLFGFSVRAAYMYAGQNAEKRKKAREAGDYQKTAVLIVGLLSTLTFVIFGSLLIQAGFAAVGALFIVSAALALFATLRHMRIAQKKELSGYKAAEIALVIFKVLLIAGFLLLSFVTVATVFNFGNLGLFSDLMALAFQVIQEKLGIGGYELGAQWLSVFSVAIFATSLFAAFALLQNVLQRYPSNANDIRNVKKGTLSTVAKTMKVVLTLGLLFTLLLLPVIAPGFAYLPGFDVVMLQIFAWVAGFMPLLSGNAHIHPEIDKRFNKLFGTKLLSDKARMVGREAAILVILTGLSVLFGWIVVGPSLFTSIAAVVLGIGVMMTMSYRAYKIVTDSLDPKVKAQNFLLESTEMQKAETPNLYMFAQFPDGEEARYRNCYIYAEGKLYYITNGGKPNFIDTSKLDSFQQSLNKIFPPQVGPGAGPASGDSKRSAPQAVHSTYLSPEKLRNLIGGHSPTDMGKCYLERIDSLAKAAIFAIEGSYGLKIAELQASAIGESPEGQELIAQAEEHKRDKIEEIEDLVEQNYTRVTWLKEGMGNLPADTYKYELQEFHKLLLTLSGEGFNVQSPVTRFFRKFFNQSPLFEIPGIKNSDIALAEALKIWQEQSDLPEGERIVKTIRTIFTIKDAEGNDITIEQIDTPVSSPLTEGQKRELRNIHLEGNEPEWFQALPGFAQQYLKNIVPHEAREFASEKLDPSQKAQLRAEDFSDDPPEWFTNLEPDTQEYLTNIVANKKFKEIENANPWSHYEKWRPTTLRHIPGEANAWQHEQIIKKNGATREIVLSHTTSRRQGVPSAIMMPLPSMRTRLWAWWQEQNVSIVFATLALTLLISALFYASNGFLSGYLFFLLAPLVVSFIRAFSSVDNSVSDQQKGHIKLPDEPADKSVDEQQKSAIENVAQMVTEQITKKEKVSQRVDGQIVEETVREKMLKYWGLADGFRCPIILGGLVTNGAQSNWPYWVLEHTFNLGEDNNDRMKRHKEVAVQECSTQLELSVPGGYALYDLSVAINKFRNKNFDFSSVPDHVKFVTDVQAFITAATAGITQLKRSKSITTGEFTAREKALQRINGLLQQVNNIAKPDVEIDGRNRALHMAALYDLITQEMRGISTGNCKSSKDRKGEEIMYVDALQIYYQSYGKDFTYDASPHERARFIEIFCRVCASGQQFATSNANSPGAWGLKGATIFDPDIIARLKKLGVYKQMNETGDFNKPGSFWNKQFYKIIFGAFFVAGILAAIVFPTLSILLNAGWPAFVIAAFVATAPPAIFLSIWRIVEGRNILNLTFEKAGEGMGLTPLEVAVDSSQAARPDLPDGEKESKRSSGRGAVSGSNLHQPLLSAKARAVGSQGDAAPGDRKRNAGFGYVGETESLGAGGSTSSSRPATTPNVVSVGAADRVLKITSPCADDTDFSKPEERESFLQRMQSKVAQLQQAPSVPAARTLWRELEAVIIGVRKEAKRQKRSVFGLTSYLGNLQKLKDTALAEADKLKPQWSVSAQASAEIGLLGRRSAMKSAAAIAAAAAASQAGGLGLIGGARAPETKRAAS